ncbi:S8 family serine peptidase [Microbacterium hydrocarbonoxydans]|uniref:S8 family serine peptidase n=1 Tax=Microbacterium hydrocarbonoxydans TaxID=273678 RepID=UPI0013DAF956|nr:S8 family serine peptidase [Microbacterium hydrocarbonoxydans]
MSALLRVDVLFDEKPVPDAHVEVESARDARSLEFREDLGAYAGEKLPPGTATLTVRHPDFDDQIRRITLQEGQNAELVLLAKPGTPTFFRERVRVPITAEPGLIGVTLARQARRQSRMDAVAADLGLDEQQLPDLARQAGMRLYRADGGRVEEALKRLDALDEVEHAGAVVTQGAEGFSHLTRDIVVQFQGPRREEAAAIAKELGCELVRELPYATTTFVFRLHRGASLDALEVIEKLAARDDVAWAEPSLAVSPQVDTVTPNDFLFPGAWDRILVGAPDAWQILQDNGLQTFGDPNILLAVWDSGVQESGGVPTNPDFAGTLTNGQPKVFASFDFDNMVANNNSPWGDHGSGVAGVSVAMANNPAPGGGGYGIAGAAPNVQMMSVVGRTPYVDIEVSDQYIWMAGFDPQSPLTGFPAPLSRGADVITCSLTPGAGSPLSGTARATLDFLTTFGRGGKGTLCFFSTGNQNQNNVTARPWGAYEKSFGIAGTTLANDGVTEVRATMSGWGSIALSSPTEDYGGVHNPPTGYCTWGAAHLGGGNLPSHPAITTTMTAASTAGATTITVASVAGLAAGQVIHIGAIGANGSEPARISAVNAGTKTLTVEGWPDYFTEWSGGLVNAHANGAVVVQGPANHTNAFGGTSSATPLAAGVAALVLSAKPQLTWVQARQVLRDTAVRFDLANTDPVGQWLDAAGNPSVTSGQPAVRSGWYGYGRIDAAAAVQGAISFGALPDVVMRDNLSDSGNVPSTGAFWNTPDVWCRTTNPASDPGALPAGYGNAGPHQDPIRGQANWIYARVRNRSATVASNEAWVRLSITHWPGTEFIWPASFIPTNGPGDPIPSPMTHGTYFIGEAKVGPLAPGAEQIVTVEWPAGLVPPDTVMIGGSPVKWHPCLLAEVTPHDGPLPTGNHVWDDNNLAQKNIAIVDADTGGGDFATGFVIGQDINRGKSMIVEVLRGDLPKSVRLYLDLVDPVLRRRMRALAEQNRKEPVETPTRIKPTRTLATRGLAILERDPLLRGIKLPARPTWSLGFEGGREVVLLAPVKSVRVPVPVPGERPTLLVLGGVIEEGTPEGEYEVVVLQRDHRGRIEGSVGVVITVGKG